MTDLRKDSVTFVTVDDAGHDQRGEHRHVAQPATDMADKRDGEPDDAAGQAARAHVAQNHAIEGEARAIVEVYRRLLA